MEKKKLKQKTIVRNNPADSRASEEEGVCSRNQRRDFPAAHGEDSGGAHALHAVCGEPHTRASGCFLKVLQPIEGQGKSVR